MYITLEYLIIIFSYHASNNRLISDFTPSHTSVNSLGHSRLHPLTSSDTNRTIIGRLIISQTMQHFTHNRPQLEAILRSNKVQNTKTVLVRKWSESARFTVMLPGYGLTHFHSPSGVRTCSAATGWRNSKVKLPKSVWPLDQIPAAFSFSSAVRWWYFMYRRWQSLFSS